MKTIDTIITIDNITPLANKRNFGNMKIINKNWIGIINHADLAPDGIIHINENITQKIKKYRAIPFLLNAYPIRTGNIPITAYVRWCRDKIIP